MNFDENEDEVDIESPEIQNLVTEIVNLGEIDEVDLGNRLFQKYRQIPEELLTVFKMIPKLIDGMSDYRDSFWCIMHFLILCINNSDLCVAVPASKAGSILYETHDTEDSFRPEWALASISRCRSIFENPIGSEVNLGNLEFAVEIVESVESSGDQYQKLFQTENLISSFDRAQAFLLLFSESFSSTDVEGWSGLTSEDALDLSESQDSEPDRAQPPSNLSLRVSQLLSRIQRLSSFCLPPPPHPHPSLNPSDPSPPPILTSTSDSPSLPSLPSPTSLAPCSPSHPPPPSSLTDPSLSSDRKRPRNNLDILSQSVAPSLRPSLSISSLDFKTLRRTFLDACNACCDRTPSDLSLQASASTGPLTQLALRIMGELNKEAQGKKGECFLNACVWVMHLLEPWDFEETDEQREEGREEGREESGGFSEDIEVEGRSHLSVKRQIASHLLSLGLLPLLLRHLRFWGVDWGGLYGDCGRPVLVSLLYLIRLLPDTLRSLLIPTPTSATSEEDGEGGVRRAALDFVRKLAVQTKSRQTGSYEDDASAAIKIQQFLDGEILSVHCAEET